MKKHMNISKKKIEYTKYIMYTAQSTKLLQLDQCTDYSDNWSLKPGDLYGFDFSSSSSRISCFTVLKPCKKVEKIRQKQSLK